jgi:alpha-L-arabinofuranosidase
MSIARWFLASFCVVALFSTFSTGRSEAQTARLTVQADKPGPKISPTLYGIFFEEVSLAGDGGLYAELVRNRSFEDSNQPEYWSLVLGGTAKGQMAIDTQHPMSEKNRSSLKWTIAPGGEGRVGVANDGYFGIALQKDAVYTLSLAARAGDGFAGPLTVTLENSELRRTYATAKIDGLTDQWKTFQVALTAADNDPKARLVISATTPGTVWLDMVSLFPKATWKGRANGLRPDLAELLVGLQPSFMRFPGGCWVEGETLDCAQRWKTTIGPIADRHTQWNLWRYHSTNGLGFHEYLQLCEDLGAEPLFVINCGMSHKENVPLDRMAEWVQDALDAIEYANGPADSHWGAIRAAAGHPAPFHLKYIEIGNENNLQHDAYQQRYPLFHDAIKARYPEMVLIANEPIAERRADVIDEHYYNHAEFFIENADKYDTYDRNGPKIYVGEYAVVQGCGQGNLRGAIGEAAFMAGMERNSDVVAMASYAPLFANVNHKSWNPDLINYDTSRVYGLPSYYVQKMFSENRGDVILPTSIAVDDSVPSPIRGKIGLGTWLTQAEFKDVKVVQGDKVLFQSDLTNQGLKDWKMLHGDWKLEGGALQQNSGDENCRIFVGDSNWSDYTLSLKARKLGGKEGFLIFFGVQDETTKSWWNLGGWTNVKHGIEKPGFPMHEVAGAIETGRWYDIRIKLTGGIIRCYLDGKLVHEAKPIVPRPLHVVASRNDASHDIILKVVNVSNRAEDAELNIQGVEKIEPAAKAVVLTSEDPADENTLDAPQKVSPATIAIDHAAKTFRHTFPAQSVTVLRLKTGSN